MENEHTIKELEKLKQELLERARQVDITINTLKSMSISSGITANSTVKPNENSNQIPGYEKYDSDTTFRNKVMFVIKTENRFVHSREIADILSKVESNNEDLTRKVSASLSFLRQHDMIVKIKAGNSNINSFWGSKKWLDEKGNPLSGYSYNEEYVIKSSNDIMEI